jgi:hypothetical protein
MYSCICVCMYVCMHVCINVYMYVCVCLCMYVGVENDLLLQLPDILYFEGTETLGTVILNFVQLLPCLGFHIENSLCWTLLHTREQNKCTSHCALHVCCGQQFELACVINLIQCTVQAAIVLAICESCSWQSSRATSVISRQEIDIVFNHLSSRCHICLRDGGCFQSLP